jgi:undecaprenyl-diphosphatase
MRSGLSRLDQRLFEAAARHHNPPFDAVLPRLTRSADHGRLWYGVAAVLAATGHRRAAARGLASLTVASSVANIPAKLATRRQRPQLHPVPVPRRLMRQPTTSSFPSGHSASAGAFALGVALEEPKVAVPVGLLAAGVAYGRVHTGVHYPGDVVAGLALGAASALAVRRVWPARPQAPAGSVTADDVPALPDGAGLVLVINSGGGSADQADEVEKLLAERLPRAEVVRASDDLVEVLRDAASRATVLGAMGGDGTLNCAATIALEKGLPLAVFPGGTLNHFAADLGVSSPEEVVEALQQGSAIDVAVGSAAADGEGLYFLNTFALGVYPDLVRERERHEGRLGKWPAMVLATFRVLRDAEPVEVEVEGTKRTLWTLFAGNGFYHPPGFVPTWRERLDEGSIDIRIVDASRRFARTRLALAVLGGTLARSRVYEQRVVGRIGLDAGESVRIARDGEVDKGPGRMLLRAAAKPLVVYRPRQSS